MCRCEIVDVALMGVSDTALLEIPCARIHRDDDWHDVMGVRPKTLRGSNLRVYFVHTT